MEVWEKEMLGGGEKAVNRNNYCVYKDYPAKKNIINIWHINFAILDDDNLLVYFLTARYFQNGMIAVKGSVFHIKMFSEELAYLAFRFTLECGGSLRTVIACWTTGQKVSWAIDPAPGACFIPKIHLISLGCLRPSIAFQCRIDVDLQSSTLPLS